MKFGLYIGDEDLAVPEHQQWATICAIAERAQQAGVSSLMFGQHFLYSGYRWLQPTVVLARLAGEVDTSVRLSTGILELPLHHPVALAEELATLDVVTEGRLDVGVGIGYRREEFDAMGVEFARRGALFDESLHLIRRLWTDDVVTADGSWPLREATPHIRPVQRPTPPVYIGAQGPVGVRRAATMADGWLVTPRLAGADLYDLVEVFRTSRQAAGLSPGRTVMMRHLMVGRTADEALDIYASIGQDRAVAYASRGHERIGAAVSDDFRSFARTHVIHGTAADCLAQMAELRTRTGADTVVFRAHWPGMSTEDSIALIDQMAREVLPAIGEL